MRRENDSIAISESVTSTDLPKSVVVLRNDSRTVIRVQPKRDQHDVWTDGDVRAAAVASRIVGRLAHELDQDGRKTADAIMGSRLVIYEGAPYALFITEKDRFNRDLLAFVAG